MLMQMVRKNELEKSFTKIGFADIYMYISTHLYNAEVKNELKVPFSKIGSTILDSGKIPQKIVKST